MSDPQTPETALDPLIVPTSEYAMRNAANILSEYARRVPRLTEQDELDLNYAYQQLHRGANTLRTALQANADTPKTDSAEQ